MHSVGIKTFKIRLSECVRATAAGETVLVADRGQSWPRWYRRAFAAMPRRMSSAWVS